MKDVHYLASFQSSVNGGFRNVTKFWEKLQEPCADLIHRDVVPFLRHFK